MMIPPPDQWDDLLLATAAVLTALGGLIAAALAGFSKLRTEIRHVRTKVERELSPNSGSSARDAIARTETAATSAARSGDDLAAALADLRREVIGEVRGMRRDIGRLADSDQAMSQAKEYAHARLHRRIDQLEETLTRKENDA